jgi:exopolyphosphatase/guanosine-5'-triphosphate,3'-diphosphate pyrophosphatase
MRVAAVDCGTNSLRLLIADLDPGTGSQVDVDRRLRIARLGEGVDRTGSLAPAAIARAISVIDEYAAASSEHHVESVRVAATSAARDAGDISAFAAGVHARLGVAPEILSGAEEARLTATGALRRLPDELPHPALVVDIGGGSTEVVTAARAGRSVVMRECRSLDVGSVRLTERHLVSDPSTPAQRAAVVADVDRALDDAGVDWKGVASVVGVAGTVTAVAAHVLGLSEYDEERVHGAVLGRADVLASCRWFAEASVSQRRQFPWLPPGRADVMGAGVLILERVLHRVPAVDTLVASEYDILDGLAWSLVE